jgi:hypothetical protein
MVIVAMGNDETLYPLQPVASYLLEEGSAAVDEEMGPPDGKLVPDALTHSREGAVITENTYRNTVSHPGYCSITTLFQKAFLADIRR